MCLIPGLPKIAFLSVAAALFVGEGAWRPRRRRRFQPKLRPGQEKD